MASLESYLRVQFRRDKQQIQIIDEIVDEVVPIFSRTFADFDDPESTIPKGKTWPYTVTETSSSVTRFSFSTHSMILFALDAIIHRPSNSVLVSERINPRKLALGKEDRKTLFAVMRTAKQNLVDVLRTPRDPFVHSPTFGDDDPLTLTWLAELAYRCRAEQDDVDLDALKTCKDKIVKAAETVFEREPSALLSWPNNRQHYEIEHSFLKLRCLHLAIAAGYVRYGRYKPYTTKVHRESLETAVHRQLGYSTVPDSRFDPAELVFATEGVLQFDRFGLNRRTIERIFATLEESQERTPYWRPVGPFLGTKQGMVLFPVSVEIVNSLLRICGILDDKHYPVHFSLIEPLLRRYTQWVIARLERFANEPIGPVAGWHSEHVNEPGLIHLWETSQVLLFLVHYASMLQGKIAADGLAEAGLTLHDCRSITRIPGYWDDEPLCALALQGARHYAVLSTVRKDFIERRKSLSGDEPKGSLLLYGPAGTGKTTLAEQMMIELGWPLLTITVSDFLADGAGEVEARAKGVFQVLQEQEEIVILFDEIDQFLLDRNSDDYRKQTGIFQFMTPGMLTKFQDLKDAARSIFIVATNYEERIDSAIKRKGRFDNRLLLSLPDTKRRAEFMWGFLCSRLSKLPDNKDVWKTFTAKTKMSADAKEFVTAAENEGLKDDTATKENFLSLEGTKELLSETALYGFGDLKYLVNDELAIEPGETWTTISEKLKAARERVEPSVKLRSYRSRFPKNKEQQYPFEELAILRYLVREAGKTIGDADDPLVEIAKDHLDGDPAKLKEHLPDCRDIIVV